jgi:hypothetical protein
MKGEYKSVPGRISQYKELFIGGETLYNPDDDWAIVLRPCVWGGSIRQQGESLLDRSSRLD